VGGSPRDAGPGPFGCVADGSAGGDGTPAGGVGCGRVPPGEAGWDAAGGPDGGDDGGGGAYQESHDGDFRFGSGGNVGDADGGSAGCGGAADAEGGLAPGGDADGDGAGGADSRTVDGSDGATLPAAAVWCPQTGQNRASGCPRCPHARLRVPSASVIVTAG